MPELTCCSTWDDNQVIAENETMRLVRDGFPVRPGHSLVIPRRHVVRYADLTDQEALDLHRLIRLSPLCDLMISINDGRAAGRTISHLHVHVIPILDDDPLPAGGIRGLFVPTGRDPYLNRSLDA
jgi:diadenosine tetraphosphate (Ap4A) HIT family hydrolase